MAKSVAEEQASWLETVQCALLRRISDSLSSVNQLRASARVLPEFADRLEIAADALRLAADSMRKVEAMLGSTLDEIRIRPTVGKPDQSGSNVTTGKEIGS